MASNVARLVGEKDIEQVRRLTTQGLVLSFVSISAVCFAMMLWLRPLFTTLGADPVHIPLILSYMSVWLISVPFITTPMVGNSSMRAEGDAITPAIIMTIVAVTNLILDPILIFGLLGAPALGIAGAAWATLIANITEMVAGILILGVKKKRFHIKFLMQRSGWTDSMKRIYLIALPIGITSLILPASNAVVVAILSKISIDAVTAFGIAGRVEAVAFILLMALSTAMTPLIGQNWGAKNLGRVYETLQKSIRFSVIFSLSIAIILGLTGQIIAGFFSTDPAVIKMTQLFFWVVPISYALNNLTNGWMSTFNALGKPKYSLAMMVIKYVLVLIPALWIGQNYGVIGVFIALSAVNIVTGAVFHIMGWRAIKGYA